MVRLEKHGDSAVRFIFTDSDHYLYKDGVVDVPVNSLSLVIDESEMVTFKKASTGDPFISFRLDKSNFSSRDELLTFYKENMVGAGGISEEEVQEMIDAATSGIPSSEVVEQLRRDVNAVSGEVDTKQDILTAGENITISGNVISADNNIIELTQAEYDALETKDPEVLYIITDAQEINMNDYYTKSEVDASIATKADASALTAVNNVLTTHTANTTVHVTQAEKNAWNGKVDTTTYESGQYATAQALNALQENKLDASAYTPTDLSEYWTSAQTQSAIDTATSGIPSSQVIEALRSDLNTVSGAVIDNEYTVSQAINSLNNRVTAVESGGTGGGISSGEVQTMIDDSLDIYWTSAQTQTAIDAAKAYYVNGNVWLTQGITDADWDGLIAAMNAHRPINATIGQTLYTCESIYLESATILWFTASDGAELYSYRIEKNGSNDYALTYNTKTVAELSEVQAVQENINSVNSSLTAHTADTTVHVTQAEKNVWNTKQDALTAGRGIFINAGFISTPTAVLGQGGTVGVTQIVKLTQAQYDALSTKDAQTLYIVVD